MAQNLNTKQAAIYLESKGTPFTFSTLEMWRSQGRGPKFKKVEGKVFYEKCDLDEFSRGDINECSQEAASR